MSIKVEITNLGKKEFKLLEDLSLTVDQYGTTIFIPSGFVTDLASIPSFLFWLQWGKWNKAAIIHDFIYSKTYYLEVFMEEEKKIFCNRKDADILFYKIMLFDGVNVFLARLMYLAVRIFGKQFFAR